MSRIVVASNRGPVSFAGDGSPRRGGGGLASALGAAMADSENTWIAAAMTDGDRARSAEAGGAPVTADTDMGSYRLRFVVVAEDDYTEYYDVVANRLLWPALHRLFDPVRRPRLDRESYASWDRFVAVNEEFAAACCAEAGDGDHLLVQDYHLALVPRMVRLNGCGARIAHFSHTAWPAPDALHLLPAAWVKAVVEGMLGADVVGFHSPRWAGNFARAAEEVAGARRVEGGLEIGGRMVRLGVFPLGPDAEALAGSAASGEAARAAEALAAVVGDRRLVLRVERLEPAKNTLRGLLAWQSLLEDDPDLAESAVHVVMAYPSRQDVPEYRRYKDEVEGLAGEIDRTFPGSVVLLTDDDYPRSLAALCRYDVLVVNSIADGLNLVAKEGSLLNQRDGTVVLSREAGAVDTMGEAAFVINPFDTQETAQAIRAALAASPEERAERAARSRQSAKAASPVTWLESQRSALS